MSWTHLASIGFLFDSWCSACLDWYIKLVIPVPLPYDLYNGLYIIELDNIQNLLPNLCPEFYTHFPQVPDLSIIGRLRGLLRWKLEMW